MNIYFHCLKIGYPNNLIQPSYNIDSHIMHGVLGNKNRDSCFVCRDINLFKDDKQKKTARKAFLMLYHNCLSGLPLKDLYASQGGAYHEALSVNINGLEKKVIRIRKSDIRLYFVFLQKKLIIFCVKIKKTDKLPNGEEEHFKNIVKSIFKYEDESTFNKRLIQ